jgi:hypothetical protein
MTVTVAALIVLASCLPGHAKLGGDLRPSEAEVNGVVDKCRKLRLCLLLRNPGAPDPLQHLRRGHPGNLLRLAGRFRWCWPLVRRACLVLGLGRRLGLLMRSSMQARCDSPGCMGCWSPTDWAQFV